MEAIYLKHRVNLEDVDNVILKFAGFAGKTICPTLYDKDLLESKNKIHHTGELIGEKAIKPDCVEFKIKVGNGKDRYTDLPYMVYRDKDNKFYDRYIIPITNQ